MTFLQAISRAAIASMLLITIPSDAIAEPKTLDRKQGNEAPKGPLPFYGKIDTVDVEAKAFTIVGRDGKARHFKVTDETKISIGKEPAKLEDLKPGSSVRGSRIHQGKSEWLVVKLTIGQDAERAAVAVPSAE